MAKATTVGTVAVLALTGGIAYRAVQSQPAPAAVKSAGPAPIAANRVRSRVSQDHRAEGPCQVIRDFLIHHDESSKESPVSGHIAVSGGSGEKVDLSFNGRQEKGAEETDCGEGKLAYLIALVADPVNSHLALSFDRSIESLVRGATTAEYSYVNYYFPWQTDLSRDQPDPELREEQKKEKQEVEKWPGLLLFRGKGNPSGGKCKPYENCPLAIFLVAETPTAGISRIEFHRAVSYITNGRPSQLPIPIVGPSFSGSVESLIEALREASPSTFKIFNGSATSDTERDKLSSVLARAGGPGLMSFIHPDEVSFKQLGLTGGIAILSEDATSFGGQAAGWGSVTSIVFPREISQLRNATPPAPTANPGTGAVPTTQLLPLDLRDATSGRDSILNYSGQTPSSQEAVLMNIGRELQRGRYSFIGVMASDPLDGVFLSRAVRQLCPDARLFSLDNDLLFVRAAHDSPLTGMLSVNTYPLFLANQRWSAPNGGSQGRTVFAFPNQISEAVYNATVAILNSFGTDDPKHVHGKLLDYVPPACPGGEGCSHAPIWVTVVGRGSYWPVAMIPTRASETGMAVWREGSTGAQIDFEAPNRIWTSLFLVASIWVLLYAGLIIRVHVLRQAKIKYWQESFWVIPNEPGVAGRAAYLAAKTFAILTGYCVLTAPYWRLYASKWPTGPMVVMASLLCMGLLLIAALTPFFSARKTNTFLDDSHVVLAILVVLFSAASIAAWSFTLFRSSAGSEPLFLAWRSLNLLSGVSPMLPVLIAAAGVLWWAWMHFRRLLLLAGSTPELPNISLAGIEFDFSKLRAAVNEAIGAPFFHWKWRVVTAVVIFAAIASDRQGILRTIEGPSYDWMFRAALGLVASLIFLSFARMLVTWGRLKRLLEQLERHPIRGAFSEMPKERVRSPVMQKGALARSYLFETRVLDSARALRTLDARLAGGGLVENLEKDIPGKLERVARGLWLPFNEARATYSHIQTLAEDVAGGYLAADWNAGSSETLDKYEERAEAKTDRPPPLAVADQIRMVASELVALPYLFYIRVSLLQIHNLLFFVIGGFVLAVCSIGSYPFQSPRALNWWMTAAMLALGWGVVRMLAQMSKDAVLSRITETEPGKLDTGFYLKLAAAGALPVISVVVSQFPSVGRFFFSWLEPTLEALK